MKEKKGHLFMKHCVFTDAVLQTILMTMLMSYTMRYIIVIHPEFLQVFL